MNSQASAIEVMQIPWRDDARVIGVVSFAHLVSHFFQLLLASLFPWIQDEFGYSYTELGLIMSVLFTVSGLGQAAAGFIVDRYGALKTLCAGLLCLSAGAVVLAASHQYAGFLIGAALIGLGNCVFHPVDYWFLNHRVSTPRLGAAFSAHGLTGSLGWGAAPLFLVAIANLAGWRVAIASAALIPIIVIGIVLAQRPALSGEGAAMAQRGPTTEQPSLFGFLRLPALWWCFAFFLFVSAALGGVQSFAPTVFSEAYGLSRTVAASSVTFYMVASAAGMLAGGWLVSRSQALERNITLALAFSVVAAVIVGLHVIPGIYVLALMPIMGFGSGLSGPSRDMLIRAAAPAGATGRVYGVVYSGLDAGIALGPLLFGRMLDHGFDAEIYYAVAACLFLSVLMAWKVARLTAAMGEEPRT